MAVSSLAWSAEHFLETVHCSAADFALLQGMHETGEWLKGTGPKPKRYWGLMTEFRYIKGRAVERRWVEACWEPDASLFEEIDSYNADGWNIFFGVLPRLGKGGTALDVPYGDTFWADLDAKHFPGGKEEAWDSIHKEGIPQPTIVVDSGHGYHCYWNLGEYFLLDSDEARAKFSGYLHGIEQAVGGDHVHDVNRVMRVAGTLNWKDKPVRAEVVEKGKRGMSLSQFEHLWSPVKVSREAALTFDKDLPVMDVAKLRVSDEGKELIVNPPGKGDRSQACYRVIAELNRAGYSPTEIKAVMKQNRIGDRYYGR